MTRLSRIFLVLLALGVSVPGWAFPDFLDAYREDPFRNPDVDSCGLCHVDPNGGGDNTEFGLAFYDAGFNFTPMLRADYPDSFTYRTSRIGDLLVVHFTDPENNKVVVELEGQKYLVDLESRSIPGLPDDPPPDAPDPAQAPPPDASGFAPRSDIPVDTYAREGAFFGSRVVNLSNAKPMRRGGVEFLIGHRFNMPVFTRNSPKNIFGFDGGAFITFGVQVGLTDWMSVSAMRSNLGRTVELASSIQFSRQNESGPLTTQLRVGVEGRDNFQERFAPFAQFVSTRTFGDRFSLAVAPSIAFNTRDEETFLPAEFLFGNEFDYTAALGLGAGLRLTQTVSLVGEYVPRLKGFTGELFDRPAVSVSVQKATFRHTFQFVLSTARPLTTAQYTVNGTDAFKVGFNIYRRLR